MYVCVCVHVSCACAVCVCVCVNVYVYVYICVFVIYMWYVYGVCVCVCVMCVLYVRMRLCVGPCTFDNKAFSLHCDQNHSYPYNTKTYMHIIMNELKGRHCQQVIHRVS